MGSLTSIAYAVAASLLASLGLFITQWLKSNADQKAGAKLQAGAENQASAATEAAIAKAAMTAPTTQAAIVAEANAGTF